MLETTALGAAIGAGLAINMFSPEFLEELLASSETIFEPKLPPQERQAKTLGWARAVTKSFENAANQ